MPSIINTSIFVLIALVSFGGIVYLLVLICKALRKYIRSAGVRKDKESVKKTLGEAIKENRIRCKMTQEFVAEVLGVSRQAVSKWENGDTDPSTSNLIELAKLFKIAPEELLNQIHHEK